MTDRLSFTALGTAVAPLSFFYFYYLAWTVKSGAIQSSSAIDALMLASMVARLAAMTLVPRLRRARSSIVIDVFSIDVLVAAALLAVYLALGARTPPAYLTGAALAWLPALLLAFPPYALYRLGAAMLEDSRLATVLPFSLGLFSMLVIPSEVATLSSSPSGLSGVSQLLLKVFLGEGSYASLLPKVTVAGGLLYVAAMLYIVSRAGLPRSRQSLLLMAMVGSLVTLGWSVLGSTLTEDTLYLFTLPGFAILGVIWWTTRGRREE